MPGTTGVDRIGVVREARSNSESLVCSSVLKSTGSSDTTHGFTMIISEPPNGNTRDVAGWTRKGASTTVSILYHSTKRARDVESWGGRNCSESRAVQMHDGIVGKLGHGAAFHRAFKRWTGETPTRYHGGASAASG